MRQLSGRTYVVTGANSGVGRATTEALAARGAAVVMVCRSRERGEAARREIGEAADGAELQLRLCDLASLRQVRDLGAALSAELDGLDGLVNNAGVYRARLEHSEDGFELTMAVNHLAHFLLTALLLDRLRERSGRVVTVSSETHRGGKLRRAPLTAILRGAIDYSGLQAYSDSKLANVLFTFELARRLRGSGVTTTALHPGMLATRIWNQNDNLASLIARLFKPFMGAPRVGGRAVLRQLADPQLADVSGAYFDRQERSEPAPAARDRRLTEELWELSAELTELRS